MGFSSPIPTKSKLGYSVEFAAAILLGVLGAIFLCITIAKSAALSAVIIFAVPVAVLVVMRPRVGVLLLIFCMAFIEEFPGGLSDQDVDRSARTLFYRTTMGISAFYIPDALVLGTLAIFIVWSLIERSRMPFQVDKIGMAMILIFAAVFITLLLSAVSPDPFGDPVQNLSLVGSVELPEKVARLIAILQFKLFLIIIPSYILGLYFFREEKDIRQMFVVVIIAMVGTVALAAMRVLSDPAMVFALTAVVYDTASVWLMALSIFFFIGMWACRKFSGIQTALLFLLCFAMMVVILLSFRRTMWGAIAIALMFFPFILPRKSWGRLFLLLSFGCLGLLMILGGTPVGNAILASVIARVQETSMDNSSTLYRFAIFVWTTRNFGEIPLFGFGVEPLWNEIMRVRFFETSMENVHSLYFWILLRLGPAGFLICTGALVLVIRRIREVYKLVEQDQYKILVGVVFLALVMFLFSGIFNPSYGRVRFLVPLGLMLALVTRLPHIVAKSEKSADV